MRYFHRAEGKSFIVALEIAIKFMKSGKSKLELLYNNEHYCKNIDTFYIIVFSLDKSLKTKEKLYKQINFYLRYYNPT
jgi:hypothetical protein